MVFIKKQNKLINKNHILHSETHTPCIKIKALSLHMLNKKIFLNRQISRTLVRQPNQQFALFKTSTDALKKINSRASQVQRPETNTLCKFQTDRNQSSSFVRSDKPVSIYTCVKNISSDTTLPQSLSSHFFLQAQDLEISVQAKRWNFGLTAICWSQALGTWTVI